MLDTCLEPSGAHSSKDGRPRKGKTKQAQTGAGKKAVSKQVKKKSSDSNLRLIIIGLAVVALVGGAAGIAVFLMQDRTTACDDADANNDPVAIGECTLLKCKFDISTCTLPCPFGYNSKSDDDICPVSCTCASQGNFEGDVHFVGEDLPHLLETYGYIDKDDEEFSLFVGSFLKYIGQILWSEKALPSGRIPIGYKLDTFLSTHARAKKSIDDAAKMYRENSCIDIEPHDPAKHGEHFVNIKNQAGCSSSIGYIPPSREQHMSLVVGCHYVGVVAHEFLHTLGFLHEQSRPDRDSFVKIHFENMKSNMANNFKKLKLAIVFDLKSDYDRGSVMHYGGGAFSKNRQPTITSVTDGKPVVGQRKKMSDKDLNELNRKLCPDYQRSTTPAATTTTRTPARTNPPRTTRQPVYTRATTRQPYTTRGPTTTRQPIRTTTPSTTSRLWPRTTTLQTTTRRYTFAPTDDKGYSEWTQWYGCTATCGPWSQKLRAQWCYDRSKGCGNPKYEQSDCNRKPCVTGGYHWSQWGDYGSCTTTCGIGVSLRYRFCPNHLCVGLGLGVQICYLDKCPGGTQFAQLSWGIWTRWSRCSVTCNGGRQMRVRYCRQGTTFTSGCPGNGIMFNPCNAHKCNAAWGGNPPAPMFMRQSTSVAHLCSGATSDVAFIFGDFNGDRNVDVMCGSQDGDFEVGLATSNGDINTATWRGRLDGCVVQSGQIAVGDFNGDAMSDIVCVDHIKKRTTVRLSNNGQFPTGEGYSGSFCTDDSDWLIPLDIDGDNKWDLMCSHSNRENELLISRFNS
ncbi:LOW QUALITY PROTEIN: uncharacterized protein LOC100182127 [Ciona intestinalis]